MRGAREFAIRVETFSIFCQTSNDYPFVMIFLFGNVSVMVVQLHVEAHDCRLFFNDPKLEQLP